MGRKTHVRVQQCVVLTNGSRPIRQPAITKTALELSKVVMAVYRTVSCVLTVWKTHRALDAAERQSHGSVPVLRRLLDEVVDGLRARGAARVGVSKVHSSRVSVETAFDLSVVAYVADLGVGAGVGICRWAHERRAESIGTCLGNETTRGISG